jgi:hypothetical protein
LWQLFLDFSLVIFLAQVLNWTMLSRTVKRRLWLLLGDKLIHASWHNHTSIRIYTHTCANLHLRCRILFYTQATKLPNRMSARPTGQPISPRARYPQRAPNPLTAPHPIPHEPRNPTGQTRFICTHQIPFSPDPSRAAAAAAEGGGVGFPTATAEESSQAVHTLCIPFRLRAPAAF